ncbi:MAG: CCA tRNA nucleotidyltransferase [Geitlerinemataceae cyanobacterium]
MKRFATSPLSPENWPFALEELPGNACLVGGAVRDALLERRVERLDLDFVLPARAIDIAREVSVCHEAGFVVLDKAREIARVVFPSATVDFAMQEGMSLEADLHRRDFTVNAIAYDPRAERFIDPLDGRRDLERRHLRMVSADNLHDDPLRLLRAYRQAAQLGFEIDAETRATIRQLAPELSRVAAERICTELGYLLATPNGTHWLRRAIADGLLGQHLPSATAERAARLVNLDRAATSIRNRDPQLYTSIATSLRSTLETTPLTIAKLASIVDGDRDTVERELKALKYSKLEWRSVLDLRQATSATPDADSVRSLTVRELFFWFKHLGETFLAWYVWAIAQGIDDDAIAPLLEMYRTPNHDIAHPTPFVNGQKLVEALSLPRGPIVGELLTELAIARAEGKVETQDAAIELAQTLYGDAVR